MKKICIITNNDTIWNIPLWWNTIDLLKNKYIFDSILVLDDTINNNKTGVNFYIWYIKTFGLLNFCLISIFALFRYFNIFAKYRILNFNQLGTKKNIKVKYLNDLDSIPLKKYLKNSKITYVLNLSTHIFKKKHIDNNYYIINAHAGFLPLCKGVMPFIWSSLYNIPYGFSAHLIENQKINSGKILYRKKIINKRLSMIGYYLKFFKYYPYIIIRSLKNFENNIFIKNKDLKNKLFSYPNSKTIKKIERKGIKIINIKDIIKGIYF